MQKTPRAYSGIPFKFCPQSDDNMVRNEYYSPDMVLFREGPTNEQRHNDCR